MFIKKILNVFSNLFKKLIFNAIGIHSIKYEDLYILCWLYGFGLFIYGFYFVFMGIAEFNHIIYASCSFIVFASLVIIGKYRGIPKGQSLSKNDNKISFIFHLNCGSAILLAQVIRQGMGIPGLPISEEYRNNYIEIAQILTEESIKKGGKS